MRRSFVVVVVAVSMVGMLFGPAEAKKKKKKKPAPQKVDQSFFLRSTGCPASDPNSDYLSMVDADEEVECFFTGAGIRYEIGAETGTIGAGGTNVVSSREDATRYWDALDGIPFVLDTSKMVTGEIWTSGGSCVVSVGGAGCSPAPLSAGEMIVDITLVGTSGGEENEIGAFNDTYDVIPGTTHKIELEIAVDPSLQGMSFDTLELRTWQHGMSVGHGVIRTNGEESSYFSVPTLVLP